MIMGKNKYPNLTTNVDNNNNSDNHISSSNSSYESNFTSLCFKDKTMERMFTCFYYSKFRFLLILFVFQIISCFATVSTFVCSVSSSSSFSFSDIFFYTLTACQWIMFPLGLVIHLNKKVFGKTIAVELFWLVFSCVMYLGGILISLPKEMMNVFVIRYEKGVLFGIMAAVRIRLIWVVLTLAISYAGYVVMVVSAFFFSVHSDGRLFVSLFSELINSLMVWMYVRSVEKSCRELFVANMEIKKSQKQLLFENRKTIKLLENIFPAQFVLKIRKNLLSERVNIFQKQYGCIYFADLKNFTKFCSEKSSENIVSILNEYFKHFDYLCMLFDLTKICSVGDAILISSKMNDNDKIAMIEDMVIMCTYAIANIVTITKTVGNDLPIRSGIEIGEYLLACYGSVYSSLNFALFSQKLESAIKLEASCRDNSVHVSREIGEIIKGRFFRTAEELDGTKTIVVEKKEIDEIIIDQKTRDFYFSTMDLLNKEKEEEKEVDSSSSLEEEIILLEKVKKKKSILKSFRLKSSNGLIYPLLIFKNLKREIHFTKETISKNKISFVFEFVGQLLLSITSLFYLVFLLKFDLLVSAFAFFSYAMFVVQIIFVAVSFFMFTRKKYFNWVVLQIISYISIILILVQGIVGLFTIKDSTVCELCIYWGCFLVANLIIAVGIHTYIKLLFFSIYFAIVVYCFYGYHFDTWVEFTTSDGGTSEYNPKSSVTFLLLMMLYECFVLIPSFVLDWFERKNYEKSLNLKSENKRLKKERNTNKYLVKSILPDKIIKKLVFEFSNLLDLRDNLVMNKVRGTFCFIQLGEFPSFTQILDQNEHQKSMEKVFSLFDKIDKTILKHSCKKIKIFQGSYLFMSKVEDEFNEDINSFRRVIDSSLECIHTVCDNLKIGVVFGEVSGGLIGVNRLVWDVIGDIINLCSRLSTSSEINKIQVLKTQAIQFLHQSNKYNIVERGVINLKGKGDVTTSFIVKNDLPTNL